MSGEGNLLPPAEATDDRHAKSILKALRIEVLRNGEIEKGLRVRDLSIVDRWAAGMNVDHIVACAEVEFPNGHRAKRAVLIVVNRNKPNPAFVWLFGPSIARAAAALAAAGTP